MTGRPTWAGPEPPVLAPTSGALAPDGDARTRPPAALVAAVAGVVALAVVEAVHVAGRDDLRTAMRGLLLVVIAAQLGLAALALRRSSAGAMGLLLCAATALIASLAGGLGAAAAVLAAAVLVLLGRSLRWFPTYQL